MFKTDLSRNEVDGLIESWIFNERDRGILHRRLTDGVQIERLAEEFGLSESQIKRIISKGTNIITSHCW